MVFSVFRKPGLLILTTLFALQLRASHIVGGDMYYDYLGQNQYRITVVLYRDCASSGAQFDDPMPISVFDAVTFSRISNHDIPFPGDEQLPVILSNPCVTPPTGICTERATYTKVITLGPSTNGYIVSYQRCCRGPNVTNLNFPEDTGLTLQTIIPGTNLIAGNNSSPRFKNYPPLVICNNDELVFDHSATDPDGDSLAYQLITPLAGASDIDPAPNPIPAPPYQQVNWAGGYAPSNPLGPGATIELNPKTGILTADPELLGLFVVGIRVSEYRNGVLIGQSDRDFLFKVVNCVIELKADITPQEESSTFISYCQGFTTEFENKGFGGTNYKWDFGVQGIDTDVSTEQTPTYTYPGPGEYLVTLVVNPGWPCTDTSTQIFKVYEKMEISFEVEDSVCITNHSLHFQGQYEGPNNPEITWNFGSGANPATGNTLSVVGVTYESAGFHEVTISAESGTCDAEYTDMVFLYDVPIIDFGMNPELGCLPFTAEFGDSSTSYAPLTYYWTFGDGTSSTEKNPKHTYTAEGSYDVSLQIKSEEGCVSELTLMKDDFVNTFPSPTSEFDADKYQTDIFNPNFRLFDQSSGGSTIFYIVDDSIRVEDDNPDLKFDESGYHRVAQVVINQYGCPDTSYLYLQVDPYTLIYVPNTFTPDGNRYNNLFKPVVRDPLRYQIDIYNRWGQLVFSSTDSNAAWDGTFQGKPCPDGIYSYKISLRAVQEETDRLYTGHINLLR
ncbi:MAG: PKD domain-containing protein [Bacteroidetes bacterium]|nr:MAG: PKD domain-containing protein [Bacteroidota bacterium]